jgi:uncharacterized protein YndB with AHSA1/START domain
VRRTLLTLFVLLVVVVAAAGAVVAAGGGDRSSVTRARLERSLPTVFANRYVALTRLQGRDDVTPASLDPKAMCDKHGPDVADVGPGGDWTCLMSWTDPEVPMPPEGYGKFEMNVHADGCYTAGGPSKLVGFLTVTDQQGDDVDNPVFEFDGCFDPDSSNTPTGVLFPSLLSVTSTTATPDADGKVGVQVTCGTGSDGCAGTVTASSGSVALGSQPFALKEEASGTLAFDTPLPAGATEVTLTFTLTTGVGPTKPVTLPTA